MRSNENDKIIITKSKELQNNSRSERNGKSSKIKHVDRMRIESPSTSSPSRFERDINCDSNDENEMDLYATLEVDSSAQINEIKFSYYRLARICHPDRVNDVDKTITTKKFNNLHRAYKILADPNAKALYDAGDARILLPLPTVKWERYIKVVNANDINQ